jgi:hypothetical protein
MSVDAQDFASSRSQRDDPGSLTSATVDRAHVQEQPLDPSRAEIMQRYTEPKSNDSTVGPPPAEELQTEQAEPEDKCSCKSLPARVVKSIEKFLSGGPLTSDIASLVPRHAKTVSEVQSALKSLLSGDPAGASFRNVPSEGAGLEGNVTVRRGAELLPAGLRQFDAGRHYGGKR